MDKTTGHTKGNFEIRGNQIFITDTYQSVATIHVVKNYEDVTFKPIEDIEAKANARLITEAFNIATETGKTPKQLQEENERLREVLKRTESMLFHGVTSREAWEFVYNFLNKKP